LPNTYNIVVNAFQRVPRNGSVRFFVIISVVLLRSRRSIVSFVRKLVFENVRFRVGVFFFFRIRRHERNMNFVVDLNNKSAGRDRIARYYIYSCILILLLIFENMHSYTSTSMSSTVRLRRYLFSVLTILHDLTRVRAVFLGSFLIIRTHKLLSGFNSLVKH